MAVPAAAPQQHDMTAIYRQFHARIFGYIHHRVGNRELAEDLTQDVFVKAFRDLPHHDDMPYLSAWLYRIATNTLLDALRHRKCLVMLPLSLFCEDRGVGAGQPDEAEQVFAGTDSMEDHVASYETIRATLAQLDRSEQICLALADVHGLTMTQCAKYLNISDTAFKMRLLRARRHFMSIYPQEADQ